MNSAASHFPEEMPIWRKTRAILDHNEVPLDIRLRAANIARALAQDEEDGLTQKEHKKVEVGTGLIVRGEVRIEKAQILDVPKEHQWINGGERTLNLKPGDRVTVANVTESGITLELQRVVEIGGNGYDVSGTHMKKTFQFSLTPDELAAKNLFPDTRNPKNTFQDLSLRSAAEFVAAGSIIEREKMRPGDTDADLINAVRKSVEIVAESDWKLRPVTIDFGLAGGDIG